MLTFAITLILLASEFDADTSLGLRRSVFVLLQPLSSLAAAWALFRRRRIAWLLLAALIGMIFANASQHDDPLPVAYLAIVGAVLAYVAALIAFRSLR